MKAFAPAVIYLLLGAWTLLALYKIFFPLQFKENRKNPVIFYHSFQAKAHKFFTFDKWMIHMAFVLWLAAYVYITARRFPSLPLDKALWFVAGYYVLLNLMLVVLHLRRKVFDQFYFLQWAYVFYLTFWLTMLTFLIYFLPLPVRWQWGLITAAFALLLLFFHWDVWKIARREWGIKPLYIILYFCTLEILPLAVFISYVI